TLTPDEVRARFGPLFSMKYLVMVDQKAGLAEIRERCRARGTIEWDAANRVRAGGAIQSCHIEGPTMTMHARLGASPAKFGAAGREIGGQALEGVEVDGDEVVTTWSGIAGAGVGVAACLPQAPGVIRAEYPSEEDLRIGGARACKVRVRSPLYGKGTGGVDGDAVVTPWPRAAGAGGGVAACPAQAPGVIRAEYPSEADLRIGGARACKVRIVSPLYEKVTIGIDDTDTREEGATWVLALKCAEGCKIPGVEYLDMRLVQLNPAVPKKTTDRKSV